jgi:hypothetical protein
MPEITAGLLTGYFGYFAQEPRGGIYRLVMEIGRTRIAVFAVSGIKVSGKGCLRC